MWIFINIIHNIFIGKVENQEKRIIRYKFKTLELIADPNNVVGNQKQKQFYTSLASSSCGIDLKVGARYLIAGNAKGPNQRLLLNLCQTYVEEYMQPNWNKDQFKNLLLTCPNVNQIIKT